MEPNWSEILLSAKLAQLVYQTDPHIVAKGVEAWGLKFKGLFGNDECQAMFSEEAGGLQHITIRGTQVSEHFSSAELWDDIDAEKIHVGDGALVCAHILEPLMELWDAHLGGLFDPERPVRFEGHSLGGNRACVGPYMLPSSVNDVSVIALAPPQGANKAFWDLIYANRPRPVIIGRSSDFALGWDHLDLNTCQATSIIHIHDGVWGYEDEWPASRESIADHSVDLYVSDIAALAELT